MEYLRQIILLLLIAGIVTSASTNAKPKDNQNDDYDDNDYAGDDDYTYDDEIPAPVENKVRTNEVEDKGSPPYFDQMHINKTVSLGEDVILPCNAQNTRANNIFMWYNGTQMLTQHHIVLSQRSRVSVFQNFSLKITKIDEYDINTYSCEILPQKISQIVNLSIAKSKLTVKWNDEDVTNRKITVTEGDPIEFTCTLPGAKDDGKMKIIWSKKGERIYDGSNGILVEDGAIKIETVEHHHHGLYQCLADGGEASPPHASLYLNVKYRPRMGIKRHYVNAAYGDRAELYCTYHANPGDVSIFWAKEGTSLPPKGRKYTMRNNENMDLYDANHTVLYIDKVDALDYGEYECVARNALGEGSGIIHLIQEPEPPRYENMTIKGKQVTLTWLTRSKQLLSEAVLDYRVNGSERWMTESIATPQPHTSGVWKIQHTAELLPGTWHARIKTKNIGGWSRFSSDHSFVIAAPPGDDVDSGILMKDDVQIASFGGSGGSKSSRLETSFVASSLVLIAVVPSLSLIRTFSLI